MGALAGFAVRPLSNLATIGGEARSKEKFVGMFVLEYWAYRHPYAARTWTLEDWRGYADGLKRLGFNMLLIEPLVEVMPSPLTSSDRAHLEETAKVIDMLHNLGMRADIAFAPNVVANSKEASKYNFEQRPLFHSIDLVDPTHLAEIERMIQWREELLRPLAQTDGVWIIDSDQGGYPGCTNDQFVKIIDGHRKALNRLRPGIELYYWMHAGWQAYGRYYETADFKWGRPEEAEDVLLRLEKVDPKPWGISIHTIDAPPNGTDLNLAQKMGLASTAFAFNYGAIEAEPSFPMTNFGSDVARRAGQASAPRGVVGNAQTHCVQLPNTFAFARGAQGQPVTEADYVRFADDLISGQGEQIVKTWQALAGMDSALMRAMADKLQILSNQELTPGPLKGLLLGNPQRFITDLIHQLRLKGAYLDLVAASKTSVDAEKFRNFVVAAEKWQMQHDYRCVWHVWAWPGLEATLRKLKSPAIDELIAETNNEVITTQGAGNTPFERVKDLYRKWDTHCSRLIEAMKRAQGN